MAFAFADVRDRTLKVMDSPDGRERVLIVQRSDGAFSYRRQWFSAKDNDHPDGPIPPVYAEEEWGPPGPCCGIFDSADTAEREAASRVPWLLMPGNPS